MRSKEVEEAINKAKQLQQFIKEKGKDFCFYDNENAVIGYECLKTVLNYIEELEANNYEANNIINDQIDLLKDSTSNSVIRDKIEELGNMKIITLRQREETSYAIGVLKEILGE